jgi:cell division topological specificity factor
MISPKLPATPSPSESLGPIGWLVKFLNLDTPQSGPIGLGKRRSPDLVDDSRSSAVNRLRLVLMHDRTQISPDTLAKMRDELVEVISKYVEIDQEALELNLEGDSNTIALMANIPVLRSRVG